LNTREYYSERRVDQTIRHEDPIAQSPLVPKQAPKEEDPVVEEEPAPPPKKKNDLELTWANTQARNDKLTDMLAELSAKFDKLADKREKAKTRARAKKAAEKEPEPVKEYEYYSDDEPLPVEPVIPVRPTPVPQQAPVRKLPVGVYRRAGPISINQF
jgi:hypothetical protein